MKRGLIISPSDLISFCTSLYGIEWNPACAIVNWVRPEAECRTYEYEMDEVMETVAEDEADPEHDPAGDYYRAYKAMLEFMKAHDVTEFTMTQ